MVSVCNYLSRYAAELSNLSDAKHGFSHVCSLQSKSTQMYCVFLFVCVYASVWCVCERVWACVCVCVRVCACVCVCGLHVYGERGGGHWCIDVILIGVILVKLLFWNDGSLWGLAGTHFWATWMALKTVILFSLVSIIPVTYVSQKETPLANAVFWAARKGNLALLQLLLNSGRVDADCRDYVCLRTSAHLYTCTRTQACITTII